MDRAAINEAKKPLYRDPVVALRELRALELSIADLDISPDVRHLRTNELKRVREYRQAALFCHGMSCRIEQPVLFAPVEAADYDFIATWRSDTNIHFAPVQLKELVPESLNPRSSIQELVDGLSRYSSDSLTVAVFLNRNSRFSLKELQLPSLRIAALWFFFAVTPDQSEWRLVGNLMEEPEATLFGYPV
nr:putative integron gene cassette protein [uncultured bacterium]